MDASGHEIPLLPSSCEVDTAFASALVELDYFGRLSMGRTRESNLRMHFDEVISMINDAQIVTRDQAGRLKLGNDCVFIDGQVAPDTCRYKLVDSPGENLSLYWRALRYGHLQSDPLEVNTSPGGDPALPTQYRPALTAADYAKFADPLQTLLPLPPDQADDCFAGTGAFTCDDPQELTANDFIVIASFLATASDKTGHVTPDLLQYLHRILKITQDTPLAAATLRTLPALIRDCGDDPEAQIEDMSLCTIENATPDLPAPANERFVDYGVVTYDRAQWSNQLLDVLKPATVDTYVRATDVPLLGWLEFVNSGRDNGTEITGFVNVANDALRAVEFLHEYELPADLGWDFESEIALDTLLVVTGLAVDQPSPQPVGTPVVLTATTTGGTAPIAFKFLLSNGVTTTVLREWADAASCVWTPLAASENYIITVWARSAGSTLDAPEKLTALSVLPFRIEAPVVDPDEK